MTGKLKFSLYRRSGVDEYWIVDPFEHIVEQHALSGNRYDKQMHAESIIRVSLDIDVRVDLSKVW